MTKSQSAAPIKALFVEALDSIPRPLTDDVIDDVFFAIQQQPVWLERYLDLCNERGQRGKTTVNTWGGFWIANAVERRSTSQVRSVKNTLTRTYSKLDQPAPPKVTKKATEEAAREALFSYYMVNKHSLPHEVLQVKEEIVDLIMSGLPPDEAFATALGFEASDDPSHETRSQG